MKRMNLGCGPDLLEGWTNVDSVYKPEFHDKVEIWDARHGIMPMYFDYDFILVNHVLCTMDHADVEKVISNLYEILKPGGKVQIIDLDLILAFAYYEQGSEDMIPASGRSLDEKFVNHISGFGTRKSLYTGPFLTELLERHGFKDVGIEGFSEYDLRPNESLIVEATK